MQYVGSKRRIAKDILSEIDKVRASDQLLVEPFCGGCNFTIHTRSPVLAADSNGPLIAMWRALQNGWQPPENLSEDEYRHIRLNQAEYPPRIGCLYRPWCFLWSQVVWRFCKEFERQELLCSNAKSPAQRNRDVEGCPICCGTIQ